MRIVTGSKKKSNTVKKHFLRKNEWNSETPKKTNVTQEFKAMASG